jgi:molecular chaperone GrpE (heat shock protein)
MKLQLTNIKADEDILFLESLEPFLDDLSKAYTELAKEFDNFTSSFEVACHTFGEDASKIHLEEFLGPIDAFIKNFERVQQDFHRRLEREEQSQRRKEVSLLQR